MIDEERLNNFVKIIASLVYAEARTDDAKEILDDYIDNGILQSEEEDENDD